MTRLLRLFAAFTDRVMATPPSTWASASYGTETTRGGGESRTPTPLAVQADRPRGCTPSP